MQRRSSGMGGQGYRALGHMNGRLAPLALDNAQRKLDVTLLSVTVGGLSREQIDGLQFVPSGLLARILEAVRTLLSRLR